MIDKKVKIVNKKWICACYIRLSQEDKDLSYEKVESNSITSQKNIIMEYLSKQEEIYMHDWYIDDGYSGTDFDRPGFQKMIEDMKNGNINCVIVKDLSRLGRNYIEVGNYLEQVFPLYKIRFIALNDRIDNEKYPDNSDNILIPFKNLINDEYCRDTSLKIRSALEGRKRKGDFIGAFAPYGYIKNDMDKHRLVIDEEASKVVKKIFYWYVFEGISKIAIAHRLNELGILNPTAYKRKIQMQSYRNANATSFWSPSSISNILNNEVYIGNTVQGKRKVVSYKVHKVENIPKDKWVVVKNTHKPIIDYEVFEKAQELLKKDLKTSSVAKSFSMWAGIIKCYDCKQSMYRKTSRNKVGKVYEYYICSTYQKKSHMLCESHRIKMREFEPLILKIVQKEIKEKFNVENFLKEYEKRNKSSLSRSNSNNIIKNEESEVREIEKIKKRQLELYEDWKNGDISKNEYHDYKNIYEKKEEELKEKYKKEKEAIKEINNKTEEKRKEVFEFVKLKTLDKISRELLLNIIDKIEVKENGDLDIYVKYSKYTGIKL